jgi:DNA (cytosine-5)-methyltransferase 1
MKRALTVVDLFCGAGGLSTGFRKAGFRTVLGIDKDKRAIETFIVNHPESKAIQEDMTKINGTDILKATELNEIDVIVGGPPCQGFSMAGKRRPNDPRNSLFREYLRLVRELKPKAFVMENVKGLLSMKNNKNEKVIDIILEEFRKLEEYNVQLHRVNTADYGVPQKRQRIFIVGTKRGYSFTFPLPTHSKCPSKDGLKKWVPIKSIILDKKQVPEKYFYSDKLIRGFRRRENENKKRGFGFGWQFNNLNSPSYTISARYWKDGAESLIAYDKKNIRMLTPQECAAVQSFPADYEFKGGEREIYIQIGNAVPPGMAQKIADSLKASLT